MDNFSEDTLFLLELSQKAGDMARAAYNPGGVSSTTKEDMSLLTETDTAINRMIIEEVAKKYPERGVLGEEEQSHLDAEILLVTDPIDGTRAFVWGLPTFGCMFAWVKDGEPYSGVLLNPIARRTLVAEKDKGTYIAETGEKMQVSEAKDFMYTRVNTAIGRAGTFAEQVKEKGGKTVHVYSLCEAASMVATGAFVAESFPGGGPHDIAAIKIVVEEAGGKVTDMDGNEQRCDRSINGVIITNRHLHEQVVEMSSGYKENKK